MPTITFPKINIKGFKKIKCKKCGKSSQETQNFWQTLSPFNKIDGRPKIAHEIRVEENVKKDAWMKIPIECNKC